MEAAARTCISGSSAVLSSRRSPVVSIELSAAFWWSCTVYEREENGKCAPLEMAEEVRRWENLEQFLIGFVLWVGCCFQTEMGLSSVDSFAGCKLEGLIPSMVYSLL